MHTLIERLLSKYHRVGLMKAGELLLRPTDALRLVDELEQVQVVILGVDVWIDVNGELAEDLGSLDLSGSASAARNATYAREFIANRLPGKAAFVSLVFDDPALHTQENHIE